METHREIIGRLGGIREVARLLKHSNHTTVQGWCDRNTIPMEHWPALIQIAADAEKPLAVADLMPPALREAAAA